MSYVNTVLTRNEDYGDCPVMEQRKTVKTQCDATTTDLLQSLDMLQSIMIFITAQQNEVIHPPEPACLIDSLDINCSLARQIKEHIEAFKIIIC